MRRPRFKAPPDRSRYGRNSFGGVVWRRDDRAHAQTPTAVTTEDNYHLYDGTNQIKERTRGNLAGTPPNYTGIAPIQQQENWTYDASGNWTQYSNPSTVPGHTQVREHDDGNELWKISVSGLGEVWPVYASSEGALSSWRLTAPLTTLFSLWPLFSLPIFLNVHTGVVPGGPQQPSSWCREAARKGRALAAWKSGSPEEMGITSARDSGSGFF